MTEPVTLTTADDVNLEGEIATPDEPRAAWVLCHPHPEHGGSMRSIVIGALFEALPGHGVACVRFNFRGVEGSGGEYTGGDKERADAVAALDALCERVRDVPAVMAGWSFGGDVALSVRDERLGSWFAVAPPLRFGERIAQTGSDPRPKVLALAQHDQFRSPDEVEGEVGGWAATRVEIVGGADHFFVGRIDRLVELAVAHVEELAAPRS